jgi:hypothetical protein
MLHVSTLKGHHQARLNKYEGSQIHDKSVPVTTAWRVRGLRMEERPVDMEGSCESVE